MKEYKIFRDFQDFFSSVGGLREIIEITYAYEKVGDKNWYNTTLFEKFGKQGLIDKNMIFDAEHDYKKQIVDTVDADVLCTSLNDKFTKIIKRLDAFRDESESLGGVVMILAHYCDYSIDMLKIAREGLPFELEKAGWNCTMSDTQRKNAVQNIQSLERKWFGKQIHEDLFESVRVVQILEELFEKYSDALSSNEQQDLLNYFKIIKQKSSYKDIDIFEKEDFLDYRQQSFFQQNIPRNCYVSIFKKVFALYEIDKYVTIDSRSSIYDGLEGLHIPSSKSYETLTLRRILELIVHEIEVHYLIQKNMATILPITDGANSLYKEEGLAKIMEEGLSGKTLDKFDITPGLLETLPGELFAGKDFKYFLYLYNRLKGQEDRVEGRLLRKKRNYPLSEVGVQHKDVTYTRGKFHVRSYLIDGGSFSSLFYGKLNFDDIKILEITLSSAIKKEMLFPKFVAERVIWSCINNFSSVDKVHNTKNFTHYLAEKYPFIDFTQVPSVGLNKQQEKIFNELMALIYDVLPVKKYTLDE